MLSKKIALIPFLFDVTVGRYDPAQDKEHLPPLGIDGDRVTIAGFSAGSYKSMEMHVAYSGTIKGSALLNGGLYAYGDKAQSGDVSNIAKMPKEEQAPQLTRILNTTYQTARDNNRSDGIDFLSNLQDTPAYVYGCANDEIVPHISQGLQRDFYEHYGMKVEYNDVCVEKDLPGHWWQEETPYEELQYLLTNIQGTGIDSARMLNVPDVHNVIGYKTKNGVTTRWDQYEVLHQVAFQMYPKQSIEERTKIVEDSTLLRWGVVYYPGACLTKKCLFQLVLHGCGMEALDMHNSWAPVADANDIVMVFPQHELCWQRVLTKQDFENVFLKKIIERVETKVHTDHDYDVPANKQLESTEGLFQAKINQEEKWNNINKGQRNKGDKDKKNFII